MTQLTPAQAFHEAQRLLRMGDYPRAGSLTQQLVQNLPDEPIVRGLHGAALARMGRLVPGLALMQESMDKQDNERVKMFLAMECSAALRRLNRCDEALAMAERAIEAEPENPEALGSKAEALVDLGRFDDAKTLVDSAGEADALRLAIAWGRACLLLGDAAAGVDRAAAAAKTVGASAVDLARLLQVLGQLCERTGRDDEAFDAWRRGARLRPAEFDADAHRKAVDELMAAWTAAAVGRLSRPDQGGDRNVFLIGAPGAGHELVEAVIASHPEAFGCGDLGTLGRVCRTKLGAEKSSAKRVVTRPGRIKGKDLADGAMEYAAEVGHICPESVARAVDAHEVNFYHAGAIPLMLPEARVVICTREPIEAALAHYAAIPGTPQTHDLEDLGRYTADAMRLSAHWKQLFEAIGARVHEVRYEDLVGDTEATARALFAFLGLGFDAACLAPEKNAKLRALAGDEMRLPISAQVHERGERYRGRTKALRGGIAGE